MRILYITQWFEPEPAFKGLDFAKALADRGHEVEVATGFPNYPGGQLYPGFSLAPWRRERMDGIPVHRLYLYPSHDRSSLGRALNYLSFFLSVLIFGLVRGRRYDAIYVYHPPITPALAAAMFTRVHRRRLILDIQDLWPDSVAASGMLGARAVSVISRLCGLVYRKADHIILQSEGMRARLISRGVPESKLSRVYNWATYQPAPPDAARRVPDGFDGHVNVVYGGNLGQAQGLETLVDAFAVARRRAPELRLHLFGNGIERSALQDRARAFPEGEMVVHAPVPRAEMDRIFEAADILAVHLKEDPLYMITIPSKTQHYLACGRPIIAGLGGEAAGILQQSGGSIVCQPGDVEALAEGLVKLATMTPAQRRTMGERALSYYAEHFGMAAAMDRTVQVIEGRCGRPG